MCSRPFFEVPCRFLGLLTIRLFRRYLFTSYFYVGSSIYFPFWYTRWTSNFCLRRSAPFLPTMAVLIEWKKNLAHVRWETFLRNPDLELNQGFTVKIPSLKQIPSENQWLEDETSFGDGAMFNFQALHW